MLPLSVIPFSLFPPPYTFSIVPSLITTFVFVVSASFPPPYILFKTLILSYLVKEIEKLEKEEGKISN